MSLLCAISEPAPSLYYLRDDGLAAAVPCTTGVDSPGTDQREAFNPATAQLPTLPGLDAVECATSPVERTPVLIASALASASR